MFLQQIASVSSKSAKKDIRLFLPGNQRIKLQLTRSAYSLGCGDATAISSIHWLSRLDQYPWSKVEEQFSAFCRVLPKPVLGLHRSRGTDSVRFCPSLTTIHLLSHQARLYDALREWRSKIAVSLSIPAYVVCTNASLKDICGKGSRMYECQYANNVWLQWNGRLLWTLSNTFTESDSWRLIVMETWSFRLDCVTTSWDCVRTHVSLGSWRLLCRTLSASRYRTWLESAWNTHKTIRRITTRRKWRIYRIGSWSPSRKGLIFYSPSEQTHLTSPQASTPVLLRNAANVADDSSGQPKKVCFTQRVIATTLNVHYALGNHVEIAPITILFCVQDHEPPEPSVVQ